MGHRYVKKETKNKNELPDDEQLRKELCKCPPVDFSYKKITNLNDFNDDRPRAFRVRRTPERGPNNRFMTVSIWLSNNKLIDLNGFKSFASKTLEQPHLLGWLDLSSNYFEIIPSELTELQNLRILYLHGNLISKLVYIKRLIPLGKLQSLTLHGNPIEDDVYYKSYILKFLPQLKSLDFIRIIPCDRMILPPPPAILAAEEPDEFKGTKEEMLKLINEVELEEKKLKRRNKK